MSKVTALVGAQFGSLSEGKGAVAGYIGPYYDLSIRVGAANAGHTLYDAYGEKHVLQQIPCQAYANPQSVLAIGPGALISPEILAKEIRDLREWRARHGLDLKTKLDLRIDPRAHVITQEFIDREASTDLAERIGSTSTTAREGIGSAQAARAMREAGCVTVSEWLARGGFDVLVGDGSSEGIFVHETPEVVKEVLDRGQNVLLEGTQGTSLSNTTGYFPFTTSRNTTAAGLAADAGVSPGLVNHVVLVARTYPIRVAGNSGPFYPDSKEISWESINVPSSNELTTVTKKVRRVATFSIAQMRDAVLLNGVTEVALMFADYLDPDVAGLVSVKAGELEQDNPAVADAIQDINDVLIDNARYWVVGKNERARVTMLGTSPNTIAELP